MRTLPLEWKTERLIVRDVTLVDVPRLREVFNACAYAEPWDPTFKREEDEALTGLASKSIHRHEEDAEVFQMQAVRSTDNHDIVGYFHLYHGVPKHDTAFISLFVMHPESQSQQLGQEAVTGLIREAERLPDHRALLLNVYLKNWPALRFWVHNGFTTIREYRGEKTHTPDGHASLILERSLEA